MANSTAKREGEEDAHKQINKTFTKTSLMHRWRRHTDTKIAGHRNPAITCVDTEVYINSCQCNQKTQTHKLMRTVHLRV